MGRTSTLRNPIGTDANNTTHPCEATIGQMSRFFNVSLRTLRFYEDRGLISPRREGTDRFYSASDRVRMEMILRGKRLGFTLSEIAKLIAGKESETSAEIERSLQPEQVVTQIRHLERQRDDIQSAIDGLRLVSERWSSSAAA